MALIGIDVGTSFIKGAILDDERGVLRHICRVPFPLPVSGLPASFVEIDPRAVMRAVSDVLQQFVSVAENARGLLLCGQMGGVILVNAAAEPLTNYLSWRDQRMSELIDSSTTRLDQLRSRLTGQQIAEIGNELRPGSSMSLLEWLQREHSLPAGAIPLSLPAFVVSQLCGAIPPEHPTLALSALNLITRDWHADVLELLGLNQLRWPQVREDARIGIANINGSRISCLAAVGDHQCALFGTALEEGELSINISTGSQVSQISSTLRFGDWQVRPYFGGRFLNTITHLPAGRSLDALVALFTEICRAHGHAPANAWEYIAERAELATDEPLQAELSFFDGPMGQTGSLTGLRLENLTVGHVFRAALQNMARNYRVCAERIDGQRTWQRIVFSGGLASRLRLLKTLILEQFDGPHRVCEHEEDTLMGLLALASEGHRT